MLKLSFNFVCSDHEKLLFYSKEALSLTAIRVGTLFKGYKNIPIYPISRTTNNKKIAFGNKRI